MLTFLSSPKPFKGRIREIQLRAIASWRATHPDAEIILYGGMPGEFSEACALGARHNSDIAKSPTGAPRFDEIARHAAREARWECQVYLNCDILLPPDFYSRVAPAIGTRGVVVGQRIDLARDAEFNAAVPDWCDALRRLGASGGARLHEPTGVDYFVFPRGLWEGLAPLIVGRGGYDGALLAFCLRKRVPIVDATRAVPAVHQFHDYGHVAGGLDEAHRGAEAMINFVGHDVLRSTPDVSDADIQLFRGQLVSNRCRGDWLRAGEIQLRHRWRLKYASYLVRALWRLRRYFGYVSGKPLDLEELLDDYSPASLG